MEQVGAILRRAREEKGLTVEDIARMTRIRAEILQQIESDDYHQISEGPFLRGFVRSYAQSLGKSEQEVEGLLGSMKFHRTETARQLPAGHRADHRAWYGVGGLTAVALVVAVMLMGRGHGNEPVPSSSPKASEVRPPIEPTPPQPEPAAIAHTVPPPAPAPVSQPVRLEIRAQEPCWVSVILDQGPYRSELIAAGETRVWEAKKGGILTLGNAGGVVVLLNDREYANLGGSGTVLRDIRVTPQGLQLPKEQTQ